MKMTLRLVCVLAIACVSSAHHVHAQSATPPATEGEVDPESAHDAQAQAVARMHFQTGVAHFERGEYQQAADEFEKAYEISGRSALLYNLALAYERLAELEPAVEALSGYLEQTDDLDAAARSKLEARLANLKLRLAEQRSEAELAAQHERELQAAASAAMKPAASERREERPLYKNPWLWTAVGVVVIGASVGLAAGLRKDDSLPTPVSTPNSLPNVELRAAW